VEEANYRWLQQVLGTVTMLFVAGLPNLGNDMVDSHKVAVDKMVLMTDFLPNNGSKVGTVVNRYDGHFLLQIYTTDCSKCKGKERRGHSSDCHYHEC
jgi:hypothetical protein